LFDNFHELYKIVEKMFVVRIFESARQTKLFVMCVAQRTTNKIVCHVSLCNARQSQIVAVRPHQPTRLF
jgi:hypothetical protein